MFKKPGQDNTSDGQSNKAEDTFDAEFIEAEDVGGTKLDASGRKAEMIISGGSVAERLTSAFLKDKPKLKSTVSVLIKSLSYGLANANNKGENNMTEVVQASETSLEGWFSILEKGDAYSTEPTKKRK